ncbi:MAG: M14 family zinc carboxypeptidase [Bacteroidota bacterium]
MSLKTNKMFRRYGSGSSLTHSGFIHLQKQGAIAMARWLLLVFMFALSTQSHAAEREIFKKVRILVPDRLTLDRIWQTGMDYEGVEGKVGGWMEFVAGAHELQQLTSEGVPYDVVIDDLSAYYAEQLAAEPATVSDFSLGSMGGYYTFAEVVQQLDSLQLLHPSLITAKESLGTTIGGRTVWAVKISDNASTNEPEEPEVLYTALHHAREPGGMMTLFYYMTWLLENYGINQEATYLVNNRQMWFIPVVNPDGYAHNQTTNPSGGGLWRKNRRDNGGSFGVDLNRNYGPFHMWNAANGGSSTSSSSDTYRGPSEFSEQETQAIDLFMRGHNVKTAFNYHTYGNYLIYPFGYLSSENSDSVIYRDWAYDMTFTGRYTNGTDQQTVNYSTRGNSDDYMFGDTTKPRAFALTPEVGTSSFWPASTQIVPLAAENIPSNKYLAYFAGHYPKVRAYTILGPDSLASIEPGETFTLVASVKNVGLSTATALSVTASASVPWISFTTPTLVMDSLPKLATTEAVFEAQALGTAPVERFNIYITFSDAQGFERTDTLALYLGQAHLLFSDSASAGTTLWTIGTGWGTTSQSHTPPAAFTDSPAGKYAANANNALTMVNAVSLVNYQFAELRFWTKWALEPTWDFATVEVSTNSGSTWLNLRPTLSRPGSGRSGSKQTGGVWGYDSYSPAVDWTQASVDLTPYAGQSVKIRFRLSADGGEERDGFYVDDIRLYGYTTTTIPVAPILVAPGDGAVDQPLTVNAAWNVVPGAATYHIQVSTDSLFVSIVVNDSTLSVTGKSLAGLSPSNQYYWRVRAKNAAGIGVYSETWTFSTIVTLTRHYQMTNQWNLVSLPLNVADVQVSGVFPTATAGAYGFINEIGYVMEDSLHAGAGYWVKFDSAQQVTMSGLARLTDTVSVFAGWNLVGAITEPIDVTTIIQVPTGIVVSPYFEFQETAYAAADTLLPAKGYWVKVDQSGILVFETASLPSHVSKRPAFEPVPEQRHESRLKE